MVTIILKSLAFRTWPVLEKLEESCRYNIRKGAISQQLAIYLFFEKEIEHRKGSINTVCS